MSNIKTTLRKAINNKWITSLNVLGLTAGFVCTILLASWIIHESTYDSFVKDKDKLYRVIMNGVINDEHIKSAGSMPGIAAEAVRQISEVESAVRTDKSKGEQLIKTDNNSFFRTSGFAADTEFFNFFQYKAIVGNLHNVLADKNNIVITENLAEKCFGDESAIGKNLFLRNNNYTVAAVLENIPTNSHLQFEYIVPTLSLDESWHKNQWGGDNSITYLKLNSTKDIEAINSKITGIVTERIPDMKNFDVGFKLQALASIPFENDFKFDNAQKTSKRNIYILSFVALLILFIACVNFTNLFISTAIKRKKEIGIKISNGANKVTIAKEYLGEVFIYVISSYFLSLVLVKILHPFFNDLSGANVVIDLFSTSFLLISVFLIVCTTLLAGLFPAIFLNRINITEVLKNTGLGGSKSNTQKVLVTAQFVVATVLIFSMITIYKQVDFLQSKNLGFDKENVLYVYTEGKLANWDEQRKLKSELLRNPFIQNIAFRGALPTEWSNGSTVGKKKGEYTANFEWIQVDKDYFDLSNIEFVEGNNVFATAHDSSHYCIINVKAAEVLGFEKPYIGSILYSLNGGKDYIIRGVTKNINTKKLAQRVDPCFYSKPLWASNTGVLLFKINGERDKTIHPIREYFESHFPEQPFEYHFLDDTYDALYKSEEKARTIISWFTVIALILTSLGLLAMVYFITEQRTKEIGVRKVNGAKVSEILSMLNRDFIKWVAIAFIIACPIAYYAMNKWLENFAYKTSLSWWIFALAGVLALGIALLTVSWQSWRAATRNPVEALRYE